VLERGQYPRQGLRKASEEKKILADNASQTGPADLRHPGIPMNVIEVGGLQPATTRTF
jgi:hypothetical protein